MVSAAVVVTVAGAGLFLGWRATVLLRSQVASQQLAIAALEKNVAALQELISGMDTDNVNKIRDGFKKLEGAMLTMSKAEVVLGSELRQQA